jgi:hypothetical protein
MKRGDVLSMMKIVVGQRVVRCCETVSNAILRKLCKQ